MGITIKIAGAEFQHFVSKPLIPVRSGLVGEFYFGTDESDPLRNWANDDLPLTAHGTLTAFEYSVQGVSKVAGYSTQLSDTPSFTVFWVGRSGGVATGNLVQVGNAAAYSGINSFKGASEIYPTYAADGSGSANFVQNFLASGDVLTAQHIVAGVVSGTVGAPETKTAHHWTGGVRKSSAPLVNDANRVLAAGTWGIGYNPNNVFATEEVLYHRAAAIYNRALTEVECDAVAAFYRAYYADRGVTI